MTIVAGAALPVILAYQAWTYWVFRKRITAEVLPEVHDFEPAIKR
jgi:cytochrome d ubiquinol oxidase subunit II